MIARACFRRRHGEGRTSRPANSRDPMLLWSTSQSSWHLRASPDATLARSGRPDGDVTGSAMKLCGFEVGLDKPLFLIAGPCVIESEAACSSTPPARSRKSPASSASTSSSNPASTRPTAPRATSFRGPGMEEGLRILAEVKTPDRRAGADRRARIHADGRSRRRRRRAADAGVPVPPDRFHPERRAAPASRSTSRRASSCRRGT